MSIWDDMTSICFRTLGDEAIYTIAATGETRAVTVIPIDEAETWQARKGVLEVTGNKIVARLQTAQFPIGWTGPAKAVRDGEWPDRLETGGKVYRVKGVREELNGVHVVELLAAKAINRP